ncbi:MAG: CDP-alcohol phosphatidyltransferase family protein [Defluviitaleaceae bacterium]|nr:CDP-alcohol phosphatidyltransferase family protein [Defluviitaleaceae bacterium]
MKIIKYVPNTLSIMRMVLASSLLVLWFLLPAGFVLSPLFLTIYIFAGITDMVDGPIARKFNVASPLGANLDGVADYFFVVISIFLIVPELVYRGLSPMIVTVIVASIIILKGFGMLVGYMRYGQLMMMHTYASKTGAMLAFLLPLFLYLTGFNENLIVSVFGVYVFFFLLEELCIIAMLPEPRRDISGIMQAWRIRRESK